MRKISSPGASSGYVGLELVFIALAAIAFLGLEVRIVRMAMVTQDKLERALVTTLTDRRRAIIDAMESD